IEVRLYDRLFNVENPSDDSKELCEYLNPNSLEVLKDAVVDSSFLSGLKIGDTFQFMRKGYYTVDKYSDIEGGKIIFNRTVDLNSSWK
ncbi:MAG: glutamine--tRNA ligase, partial [Clostridia bacterium]|nr:glutamine--tRNA ligase [Clostridia bacterium]